MVSDHDDIITEESFPREGHDVGRAGEQETSGAPILVHGEFDGRKQVGSLLYFVDDDRSGQIADKAGWVADRRGLSHGVVEREILGSGLAGEGLRQGCLAGLPSTIEQDNRGVGESSLDCVLDISLDHGRKITIIW